MTAFLVSGTVSCPLSASILHDLASAGDPDAPFRAAASASALPLAESLAAALAALGEFGSPRFCPVSAILNLACAAFFFPKNSMKFGIGIFSVLSLSVSSRLS